MGRDVLTVYGVFFLFAASLSLLAERRRGDPARRLAMRVKFLTYLGLTALVLSSAAVHPLAFAAVVAVILLSCLDELLTVTGGSRRLGMVLGTLQIGAALVAGGRFFPACLAVTAVVLLLRPLFGGSLDEATRASRRTLVALIYIPFLGSHLLLFTHQGNFFARMAFFYMLILVSDCMAMVGGHLWGRHRPWPVLSPNKTLEGAAASLLSVLLLGFFLRGALPEMSLFWVLVTALAIGVMAQLGDLVASSFKRAAGVKDYGTWLPTFGGMLDRFDSFIFAAPAFYFLMSLFSKSF